MVDNYENINFGLGTSTIFLSSVRCLNSTTKKHHLGLGNRIEATMITGARNSYAILIIFLIDCVAPLVSLSRCSLLECNIDVSMIQRAWLFICLSLSCTGFLLKTGRVQSLHSELQLQLQSEILFQHDLFNKQISRPVWRIQYGCIYFTEHYFE